MKLTARVEALEHSIGSALRPWHRVTVDVGQTEEDAIAAYVAEHGPIGEDNVILLRLVRPVLDANGIVISRSWDAPTNSAAELMVAASAPPLRHDGNAGPILRLECHRRTTRFDCNRIPARERR